MLVIAFAFFGTLSLATSSQAGTVVIVKTTIGLDGNFDFSGSAGIGNFSLLTVANTATQTFLGVGAGAYVVAEAQTVGFSISSVVCVSATLTSTFDITGASVSFQLGALDILTCTFLSVSDSTAPILNGFTRQNPATSPTSADTLVFRATFSEDVQNVDAADFAVNGTTTATVTAVTPVSGSVYDVTVSGGDLAAFNGTVGLDLAAGQDITDAAANPLPTGEPPIDETYLLDNAGVTLASFTRQNPATSPTSADTLVFRATFSEDVQNVDAADFAVNGTTTATVTAVTPVSGSVYDVTVSGGDLAAFNGTVGLDLAAGQDITDAAANPLPTGEPPIDETYLLDNAGVTLASFTRQNPATSPTSADTLVFRATFSEDVQNVDAADFAVNGTTTATVTAVTPVSGSVYDVTVSGGDLAAFNGTVGLDLAAGQDITDAAANPLPAGEPPIDETYLLDNAGVATNISAPASVSTPDPFVVTVTFSEPVSGFTLGDVVVANGTASGLSGSGANYTLTITPSGGGDITIDIAAGAATDALGNGSDAATATTILLQSFGSITIVKNVTPQSAGQGTFTYVSPDSDLNGISISTAGGAGSITILKSPGTFEISENIVDGWVLTSVSCSETGTPNSTAVTADRRATIGLEAGENVTCTFVSGRDEAYMVSRTQRLISNFMVRRTDQITAAEPDLVQRLTDGCESAKDPITLDGSGSDRGSSIHVSTSLNRMRASSTAAKFGGSDAPEQMSLAQTEAHESRACMKVPGVWVEGHWSHVETDTAQSNLGLLYLGIEYRVAQNFLFGLLTQFDWTREQNDTDSADVAGFGWLSGPYFVTRLNENLFFDGRVAWGQSDNTVSPIGTYTDNFETTRWLIRSRITGDFDWVGWRINPELGFVYMRDHQERYIDELGFDIPGQSTAMGRLTFGPRVSKNVDLASAAKVSAHLRMTGIWDFDRTELVDVETGLPATLQAIRGRLEGGLIASFGDGASLTLEGFYDGIGIGDYESYGGTTRLSIKLN